ncbi:hypothetical protein D3C81_2058330 [compost metagenome]
MLDHLTAAVGGALEGRVVDHHQLVIRRQVQVEFAALDPMLEALAKTVQCIFGGFALGTAVAVDKGHVCSFKKG